MPSSVSITSAAFGDQGQYRFGTKAIDRFSDGTILAYHWTTFSDLFEFHYSTDDGATWTDTTDDITPYAGAPTHGKRNNSMFIDANDVIWFVCRKSDFGANGIYRGTYSSGRITWGTVYQYYSGGTVGSTDLVAFEIGSDDYIGITWHDGGNNSWKWIVLKYTTSFSVHKAVETLQNSATDTGANIDFHHTGDGKTVAGSAPHMYISWCSGGLNYRRIAHSSTATFTMGSLTEIDGDFHDKQGDMYYDGTRIVIVSPDATQNTTYYTVWERNEGDTTSTERTGVPDTGTVGGQPMACWYDESDNIYLACVNQGTPNVVRWCKYDRAGDSWDASWTEMDGTTDYRTDYHIAAFHPPNAGYAIVQHGDQDIDHEVYFNSPLSYSITFEVTVNDDADTTDTVAPSRIINITIDDDADTTEVTADDYVWGRIISDDADTTDEVSAGLAITRAIVDAMDTTDSVGAQLIKLFTENPVDNAGSTDSVTVSLRPYPATMDLSGAAHLIRMPTSRGVSTFVDRFAARFNYRYQGLGIVATEISDDVWEVTAYPGKATLTTAEINAADEIFYGGSTWIVEGLLATALDVAGYDVTPD